MITFKNVARFGVSAVAIATASAAHAQAGSGTAAPAGTPAPQVGIAPTGVPTEPTGQIAPADAAQGPAPQADGVGDIIVTANKREQNLNKVGLSITAIGAEQLQARRVASVADLAQVTPGLTFAPTPQSTPVYTLRGVGFFESTLAAYPDVSIYMDQAALPLPVMSTLTAFDLERVEVLKGPQGTLFGNNATGGAINFIAAKPSSRVGGGMEFGLSRFGTLDVAGHVTGPLSDTMQARLAFKTAVSEDGWQRSYTRDDDLGKRENYAGRFLLDWQPSEALKLAFNVNGWVNKDDPVAPQKIANTPQNPGAIPLLAYPNAPSSPRAADWGPDRPYANSTFWQGVMRGDLDLGFATLTSISNYSRTRFLTGNEGGGTALIDLDTPEDRGRIRSFSQEVRLSNGGRSAFRWTVGANYERTTVRENTAVRYADTTSTLVNGITGNTYFSDQRMRNYAGFANAEFDVTDRITLKGGVRQTRAERTVFEINRDDPRFPAPRNPFTGGPGLPVTDFFNFVYGLIYQGRVPVIAPGGNIALDTRVNAAGAPLNPATFLTTAPFQDKLKEDSTSWSGGVDFKPSDTVLIYANVSRGYKAGSFPHLSGSVYTAYQPVVQEYLTDYEIGSKLQLFDRKVSLSGAAFYYDYRNKQLRAKFVDPLFGALDLLVNVPKSRVYGAELSMDARPVRGLTLSASGTYLNATVRDFNGVIGQTTNAQGLRVPTTAPFRGVRLPFSPKFQYQARIDYDQPLGGNLNGFVGAGVDGQTRSVGTLALPGTASFGVDPALYGLNARALVSANIGLHAADNSWRVTLWGKNIFNKYYWTNSIQAYDTVVRYAGRPAEYGISAGFNF